MIEFQLDVPRELRSYHVRATINLVESDEVVRRSGNRKHVTEGFLKVKLSSDSLGFVV